MWYKSSNRLHNPANNSDQRPNQSPEKRFAVIFAVLMLLNGAAISYGSTQSQDWMKALPFILIIDTSVTIFYGVAYSILVRKGLFTSFHFLITYHALLGTITFLYTYLYFFVMAAIKGGAYFPGWVHLVSVKTMALSSATWYAVHIAFLLFAIVASRITNRL